MLKGGHSWMEYHPTKYKTYWNGTSTSVNGQNTFIPKFYVKVEDTEDKGRVWWISLEPRDGFHIHPAFMHNGKEVNGFEIMELQNNEEFIFTFYKHLNTLKRSQYRRSEYWFTPNEVKLLLADLNNISESSSDEFHVLNIYEHSAAIMWYSFLSQALSLNENNKQNIIGGFYMDYQNFRVIDGIDVYEHIDETTNERYFTLRILDNKGHGRMIETGLKIGTDIRYRTIISNRSRYVNLKTLDFDLSDVFIVNPENQPHFEYEFNTEENHYNSNSNQFRYHEGKVVTNGGNGLSSSYRDDYCSKDDNNTEFYCPSPHGRNQYCWPYQCFGLKWNFMDKNSQEYAEYQAKHEQGKLGDGNYYSYLRKARIVLPPAMEAGVSSEYYHYPHMFSLQASPADYDEGYYYWTFVRYY